jgi:hypothetical protein
MYIYRFETPPHAHIYYSSTLISVSNLLSYMGITIRIQPKKLFRNQFWIQDAIQYGSMPTRIQIRIPALLKLRLVGFILEKTQTDYLFLFFKGSCHFSPNSGRSMVRVPVIKWMRIWIETSRLILGFFSPFKIYFNLYFHSIYFILHFPVTSSASN